MRGRRVEHRVRTQGTPDTAHHDRGLEPVPGDVADHDPQLPGRHGEEVVPIATDVVRLRRDIPCRERDPRALREPVGQQAPLDETSGHPFERALLGFRRPGDAIGGDLEQLGVLIGERPRSQPADVDHAEDRIAAEEGNAEHDLDTRLPQDRIRDRGGVDPLEVTGRPVAAIPPAKPRPNGTRTPCRTSSSMPHAARATSSSVCRSSINTAAVSTSRISRSREQFDQQLVDVEARKRTIGQRGDRREPTLDARSPVQHCHLVIQRSAAGRQRVPRV